MRMYDLRPEEMKRGVAAMQKLKWPPTLNEFFELCRPSIDTAAAYYEAVSGMEARKRGEKGEWSHPAIFWTASKMTHDLLNQTFSVVKLRWEKELAKELEKTAWPEVPEVAKALPAPGKTKTDRERAKHELEKLNASGLLRKTSGVAWAKKVLERVDRGESLPAISVQWAMETVGNKLQQGGA